MSAKKLTRIEDLEAIQQRVAGARELREGGLTARITVHLGTCGIASGAQRAAADVWARPMDPTPALDTRPR